MQIVQKVLKLQKIFLAQLVALKFIYNMEFRAKFYLKQQSFCYHKVLNFNPFMQIYAKLFKLQKDFLAQFVALKQMYKMQFRAKL